MFPFLRKKAEVMSGKVTKVKRNHLKRMGKKSLDIDERPTISSDELDSTIIPKSSSDPELQCLKVREDPIYTWDSNLEEDSKKLEDRNHHYLPLQVQDHPPPPQEIGRLFRSDTSTTNFSENLSLELISSDLDDPILNVHLEEVHTGVPTIVHPNERPSIVTAQTNVAEIVLSPSMIVSPEYPQAPPPSPYDNTFGDPVHEHIDDFENEDGGKLHSDGSEPAGMYNPYHRDYLGVDIPQNELSAPAEIYQMIWGKFS